MFTAEACHSAAFISPPPAQETAPADVPAEVRLARSMRPHLEKWDRMGPHRKEHVMRAYGAALAAICGVPVAKLKAETRVNPSRLAAILDDVRG